MISSSTQTELTQLLHKAASGDAEASEMLFDRVYQQLHSIARSQRRRNSPGSTLDTTGLVHEAYLKLFRGGSQEGPKASAAPLKPGDREHFYALAARSMRHILVDYARGRRRAKRGGGQEHVQLDEQQVAVQQEADKILAVHQALERLAEVEPRLAQIVECRFFAGMTNREAAEAIAVSERTAERCWQAAQAWLRSELADSRGAGAEIDEPT